MIEPSLPQIFTVVILLYCLPALLLMGILTVSVLRELIGVINVRPKVDTSPGGRTPGGVRLGGESEDEKIESPAQAKNTTGDFL